MGILAGFEKDTIPPGTKVQCIALAPPPVYRSDVTLPSVYKDKIHIYINSNDCVPRLSLANMASLMAKLRAIDNLPMGVQEHFQIFAGLDDPKVKENLESIVRVTEKVSQDHFASLEHPGQIYYLKRESSSQSQEKLFKLCTTPSAFFSGSLLLFENMVLDHLQPYYEEAFANVKIFKDDDNDK